MTVGRERGLHGVPERVGAPRRRHALVLRGDEARRRVGFLVGQVMKASRGQANAALVQATLRARLENGR